MALSAVEGTEEVSAALGAVSFKMGPMGLEWVRKVEVGFEEWGWRRRGRERKRRRVKGSWWEQRMLPPPLTVVTDVIFGFVF